MLAKSPIYSRKKAMRYPGGKGGALTGEAACTAIAKLPSAKINGILLTRSPIVCFFITIPFNKLNNPTAACAPQLHKSIHYALSKTA